MEYDLVERETMVMARWIRGCDGVGCGTSSGRSGSFEEGDKMEADYKGKGKYYPGKISRKRLNGTYDIAYDDGERETNVDARSIRSRDGGGGGGSSVSSGSSTIQLCVGGGDGGGCELPRQYSHSYW